jgi:hypothetical protein
MWDRQYFSSLAVFLATVIATYAGITALLLWSGWIGVMTVLVLAAGFLVWFYWGPRPDRKPSKRVDQTHESGSV